MAFPRRSPLVILTGTDPASALGGIGYSMKGYLRALDVANIPWITIPTYHPAKPGGRWRPWLGAFPALRKEISRARKQGKRVLVYSHAGAGISLLREFFVLAFVRAMGAVPLLQLHAVQVEGYLAHPIKRRLFLCAIAPARVLGAQTPWWRRLLTEAGISKP
ncbi:MAG: hypothetical protein D6819_03965, partial [Gammaproteobacteria bacterium]